MSLLQLNNLTVRYGDTTALHDVTLHIEPGETLGLLGESGSGKSTLGRAALRLQPIGGGQIRFDGQDITDLPYRALAPFRHRMQMVFQDPLAALNARQTIATLLEKPLALNGVAKAARGRIVAEALDSVGLPRSVLGHYPHMLSGGQRQRVVIARALSLNPKLVICDEAVSALDVSIQAQILNLLVTLKRDRNLTYLFISHDLAVVRYIADRVAVIFKGRIVEVAPYRALWDNPQHPYTRQLIAETSALPAPAHTQATPLQSGCLYRAHCPLARERCATETPALRDLGGHQVACHAAGALPAPVTHH